MNRSPKLLKTVSQQGHILVLKWGFFGLLNQVLHSNTADSGRQLIFWETVIIILRF